MTDGINEIKAFVGKKELLVGYKSVLKNLKLKRIKKIFLASNAPEDFLKELEYYSKLADVPLEKLNITNEELGTLCKKQFLVSTVGILKGKEDSK
ncbi:MAG: ribosomal L7Ae/L30e/S12e/Gadd45 family protein [Candidatus Woesearchaeota archaeon]